ncbi:MAG: ParB/RepB/Spo0J family partition protein [Clostridia bacterium]|nr:ParB/RepB/Spo0J family partition protein [Clostridia bacterium]
MRRAKSDLTKVEYSLKTLPVSEIICNGENRWKEKQLRAMAAKFVLDGMPHLSVNFVDGEYVLLSGERDYFAMRFAGAKNALCKVYRFEGEDAEIFTLAERVKEGDLSAMDEAYLMVKLVKEYGLTQDVVAAMVGKSRPAVANTLRLLTLSPEVVGLIESGQLSAGHARALVRMPKDKQYAFALSVIEHRYTVRETEKAAQTFFNEEGAKKIKKNDTRDELKALVEKMRSVFKTKVTLIGNEEKGKIVLEYRSEDDLYRLEEILDKAER